jgi:nicotinamidase/pyrazinamidase
VQPYDPRTALVVVDVQNDFADPAGSLAVAGGDQIVPIVNTEVGAATSAGALVAYTQDWHPAHTPHFGPDGGTWPVHCVAGSWGSMFHPDLVVAGPTVRKGSNGEDGYSGFTMRDPVSGQEHATELEALLRGRSVDRVLVCGLATDYCVKATAMDAARLGFDTVVLRDAVRPVELHAGDGARALDDMTAAGVRIAASAAS